MVVPTHDEEKSSNNMNSKVKILDLHSQIRSGTHKSVKKAISLEKLNGNTPGDENVRIDFELYKSNA